MELVGYQVLRISFAGVNLGRIIISTTAHDLGPSGKIDKIPDLHDLYDLYDLYDLAYVAGTQIICMVWHMFPC